MLIDDLTRKLARLGTPEVAPGSDTRAAVAAILRASADDQDAELLFIRRADRPSDPWSGHIAFPGGRHEPDDASLAVTAMRETREEVGIDLEETELVARLPDVPAFTRGKRAALTVASFVFVVRRDVRTTPNEEVAEAFWMPFNKLARGEGRGTFLWSWEGKSLELPCFRFEPGAHLLWGLTFRMVEMMLEALGPEDDTLGPASSS